MMQGKHQKRLGGWLLAILLLLMVGTGCAAPANHAAETPPPAAEQGKLQASGAGQAVTEPKAAEAKAETPKAAEATSAAEPKASDAKPNAAAAASSTSPSPSPAVTPAAKEEPTAAPAAPAQQPKQGAESVAQPSAPSAPKETPQPQKKTVTLSIIGDKKAGTILKPTEVEVSEGDTVLDVLKRGTRSLKIHMEFRGTGSAAYVEGIDNLYEFDQGPKSGWMYRVNGEYPGKGAGSYPVKAGDKVEWLYTLDLGKDIGGERK
ncbi:DUF4430 domain-containing protein [Paenibacillus cremeus]|uniref:DUF4430 domain-containing protein n=1 Tax=Paenibacillus cremeus TaxID=2163881 RepID=A0A559K650_9BACL|nr:DUF4430 domain-containing protein [Paenibacillus cremeus]TVY07609.1 DUF4430 domain-containing protein [Paenibacillus cremeus]